MIDITAWMQNFLQTLNEAFTNRVWFAGLQGSYGRGEAIALELIEEMYRNKVRWAYCKSDYKY